MTQSSTQAVRDHLTSLQDRITTAIGALDGQAFLSDAWAKPPGETLQGQGVTRIRPDPVEPVGQEAEFSRVDRLQHIRPRSGR